MSAADPSVRKAVVEAARAQVLADMLRSAHIGTIITTQYTRTKNTAAPLAARLGIVPEIDSVAAGADGLAAHVRMVVAAVRKHAGGAVLVVGHSNTIPAIAEALGSPHMADLCDGDYDQVFMLELPPTGPARFVRAHFGAPAADAKCAPMSGR